MSEQNKQNENPKSILTDKIRLIEEYSRFLQASGYTPAAANVNALLLVWEPYELHFDQIVEILKLSKGAVSGALRFLEQAGRVECITKIGVRKRFYRARVAAATEGFDKFLHFTQVNLGFMERILECRRGEKSGITADIENNIEFLNRLLTLLQGYKPDSR